MLSPPAALTAGVGSTRESPHIRQGPVHVPVPTGQGGHCTSRSTAPWRGSGEETFPPCSITSRVALQHLLCGRRAVGGFDR